MEIYDLLRLVIGIVIAIVFLFALSMYLISGDSPSLENVNKQMKSGFCNTDADCSEGVCVAGECVCFLDSQCKTSNKCNMGIGVCGT